MALTLSPMLGSKFLNKKEKINFFVRKFNNGFKSFTGFYVNSLKYWINKQKTISIFIILIVAASAYLFSFSKKELIPVEDRGAYLIIGSTDEEAHLNILKKKLK